VLAPPFERSRTFFFFWCITFWLEFIPPRTCPDRSASPPSAFFLRSLFPKSYPTSCFLSVCCSFPSFFSRGRFLRIPFFFFFVQGVFFPVFQLCPPFSTRELPPVSWPKLFFLIFFFPEFFSVRFLRSATQIWALVPYSPRGFCLLLFGNVSFCITSSAVCGRLIEPTCAGFFSLRAG